MTAIAPRPEAASGVVYDLITGCGHVFIAVTKSNGYPFEVFVTLGKSGDCGMAMTEAIGKLSSVLLRSGVDWSAIARQLGMIRCPKVGDKVTSCADAVSWALKKSMGQPVNEGTSREIEKEAYNGNKQDPEL